MLKLSTFPVVTEKPDRRQECSKFYRHRCTYAANQHPHTETRSVFLTNHRREVDGQL